jgi:murein DD-endopeptidase MepM/ murein hydrolase activator NlpD
MANQTPLELAESLRELHLEFRNDLNLMNIHLTDLQKMADMIAALGVADQHWLLYPLDRLAAVSGEFGTKYNIGGKTWAHEGIDFAIPPGNAVRACADGKVIFASVKDGYGNCVRIEHERDGEKWWTWYGHLSTISVITWTRVKADELIGLSGNTGNTTGPHLHLTVQRASCTFKPDGCAETLRGVVNPRDFIKWPE